MTRDAGRAGRPEPDPDPDSYPEPEPDPGLARARTNLAWLRTAIAFAAIGGVILKREVPAGLVVLVLGGLIWATGRLAGVPGTVVSRSRRLLLIALAVAAVSVVALVVSLLGRQPAGLRL
ncbi:MAG: hypothetical protein ACLPKI_32815 [Streptosporangiaceae bacterium]